jgi:hypothetical protein
MKFVSNENLCGVSTLLWYSITCTCINLSCANCTLQVQHNMYSSVYCSMWQEDTLELDNDLMDDEVPEPTNRVRGSSQKKNTSSPCPVCPARFTNVRRHVIVSHLPWYFSCNNEWIPDGGNTLWESSKSFEYWFRFTFFLRSCISVQWWKDPVHILNFGSSLTTFTRSETDFQMFGDMW